MNTLDKEIENKVVVLSFKQFNKGVCTKEALTRAFLCTGGFGASPDTIGGGVFGRFMVDGETCMLKYPKIERFATSKEVAELVKQGKLKNEEVKA